MKLVIEITYLVASIFFIFGIKFLGSPKTARKGNLYAAIGMFLAIAATLFDQQVLTFEWIIIGAIIGSLIGLVMAIKTPMTGMPQMVGMLNGFGGGASILVALSEYFKKNPNYPVDTGAVFNLPVDQGVAIILSILIGGVTFTGSMIAFGKLQGIVTGKVVKVSAAASNECIIVFRSSCCRCLCSNVSRNDKHCSTYHGCFTYAWSFISTSNRRC